MPVERVNLYEGLFLLSQTAAMDVAVGVEHVKGILTRHGAEVLVLRKWDERKLAYAIHGQKRGTYVLAYFKAKAAEIAGIDRDSNLSEQILRSLVIRADHVGDVELEIARKQENLTLVTKLKSEGEQTAGKVDGAPAAAPGAPAAAPVAAAAAALPSEPEALAQDKD